jgi:transcriptional regulator with PAS, ATPase and Fis domain
MQALLAAPRSRELSLTPEAVRIPVFLHGRHIGVAYLDDRDRDVALPPLAFWQTVQDLLMLASERLRRRLQSPDAETAAEGSTIRVPEPDATGQQTRFGAIIAASPAMNLLLDTVEKVAPTRASVLVCGESGTGKEMVAWALHGLSPRQDKPLVIINCAALPETLLEAELFGIERGVATGVQARAGKLEQADGGTVFLDEIGDMSLLLQTKLLRALQERSFERVGGSKTITVDVRFVAATNRDLTKAVKSGEFREDLYHRLNVITLDLPPLRERPEEIPLLVEHFVRTYSEEFMRPVHALTSSAMDFLLRYAWPGNVRELQNVIERAVILAKEGVIAAEDLPPALHPAQAAPRKPRAVKLKEAKREAREETAGSVEKESIRKALDEHDWQIPAVMTALGISRSHLYRLMHKHGLRREDKAQPGAEAAEPGR